MDSDKSKFILNAILDTQATIRAIDVKIGYLLAALLVPFTLIGRIWAHFFNLHVALPFHLDDFLFIAFLLMWVFTILCFIRALSAIDNPARHIINASHCQGVFYGGGLYQFGFLDSVLNREMVRASNDITSFLARIPDARINIQSELAFEQMKLIYIRDIKLHRLRVGITSAQIWFCIGFLSFVLSKIY
ncbi:MAG: hypothetical protein D0528_11275 [Methylococcales bacterium]|nr:MAG: hypothetical protein D0528_11275 [Methylococcales bacterium]